MAVAIQLAVGTLMHAWMEVWLGAMELGDSARWVPHTAPLWDPDELRPVQEMQLEVAFEKTTARDPFEVARLRAMILAYHLRWRDQTWRVIDVERSFRAPFLDVDRAPSADYERDGKIDAIVMDQEGQTLGVEHKSHIGPLDPDDDYWIRLRSDAQCSDYHIGASAIGHPIAGIIYDVVCKPDLDPLKATPIDKRRYTKGVPCKKCLGDNTVLPDATTRPHCKVCGGVGWMEAPRLDARQRERDETPGEYGLRCFHAIITEPDRYLIRRTVVRLDDELREHERDDWETIRELHADKQRDHHPRNTDACFAFNRRCDMHPICFGGVDPTISPLYRISKREPAVIVATEEGI